MEQNNQILLKNLSNQLAQKLNQSREKSAILVNQIFQLKKQLKSYKKQIQQLKSDNQKLVLQLRQAKSKNYHSMLQLYDNQDDKFLSTLIQDYIKQTKHPSSLLLYKHCVETFKSKSFNDFLKNLQSKLHSLQVQNKDTLRLKQADMLQNSIMRRKISNYDLRYANLVFSNTDNSRKSHQRQNSKQKFSHVRLPSFRMKTQGVASMPKYKLI